MCVPAGLAGNVPYATLAEAWARCGAMQPLCSNVMEYADGECYLRKATDIYKPGLKGFRYACNAGASPTPTATSTATATATTPPRPWQGSSASSATSATNASTDANGTRKSDWGPQIGRNSNADCAKGNAAHDEEVEDLKQAATTAGIVGGFVGLLLGLALSGICVCAWRHKSPESCAAVPAASSEPDPSRGDNIYKRTRMSASSV